MWLGDVSMCIFNNEKLKDLLNIYSTIESKNRPKLQYWGRETDIHCSTFQENLNLT